MATRKYIDNAPQATLAAGVNTSATSVNVSSLTGFPSSTPYAVTIDRGTASAEVVLVTAVSGATATVTRNWNGLGAFSHSTGATFEHTVVAQDMSEANAHVNATTGVHGLPAGDEVAGVSATQTLTNKTLDSPTSNSGTFTSPTLVTPAFSGAIPGSVEFGAGLVADAAITGAGPLRVPRLFTQTQCGTGGQNIWHNESAIGSDFYNANTLLSANGVGVDTIGLYVSGTPGRLVVPTGMGGQFRISANVPWSPSGPGSSGGTVYVTVTDNGSPIVSGAANGSGPNSAHLSPRVRTLADGDVIELHALVQGVTTAALFEAVNTQNAHALLLIEKIS